MDDSVVRYPQPDILECEVKWALRSTVNKTSGCDEIPRELFKSLKGWWWWWHQSFVFIMSANLEDPAVATELEKVNPHPNFQGEFTKEWANHWTITLISHSSKVMFKILQARLQHYVNQELPDVQAGIIKGRGTRDQTANICWIIEKAREFQEKKHLLSLFHWLH